MCFRNISKKNSYNFVSSIFFSLDINDYTWYALDFNFEKTKNLFCSHMSYKEMQHSIQFIRILTY